MTSNNDWETNSQTLSVESAFDSFERRFEEDNESTAAGEDSVTGSNHSDNSTCVTCLKPKWCTSYSPDYHHCRDYCLHKADHTTEPASVAPSMERQKLVDKPNHVMAMLPEDMTSISEK